MFPILVYNTQASHHNLNNKKHGHPTAEITLQHALLSSVACFHKYKILEKYPNEKLYKKIQFCWLLCSMAILIDYSELWSTKIMSSKPHSKMIPQVENSLQYSTQTFVALFPKNKVGLLNSILGPIYVQMAWKN